MSGAKIILQAVGEQNTYLTKEAKHTLFKKTPRRYSAFGLDWNLLVWLLGAPVDVLFRFVMVLAGHF